MILGGVSWWLECLKRVVHFILGVTFLHWHELISVRVEFVSDFVCTLIDYDLNIAPELLLALLSLRVVLICHSKLVFRRQKFALHQVVWHRMRELFRILIGLIDNIILDQTLRQEVINGVDIWKSNVLLLLNQILLWISPDYRALRCHMRYTWINAQVF